MAETLIPIFICVVLPVTIVWLTVRARQHEIDKKTEIMLKAIESGATIDTDFFKAQRETKSIKENLLSRLTAACVLSFLGAAFLTGGIFICNATSWSVNDRPAVLLPIIGGALLAVGVALFVVYFVGRKMLGKEIAAEEKALETPGK